MKTVNSNYHPTNFWFGFSIGIAAAAGSFYLLGTKQGRENLKRVIEYSENLPATIEKLVQELEKKQEEINKNQTNHVLQSTNTLSQIINKIKSTSSGTGTKKFYTK